MTNDELRQSPEYVRARTLVAEAAERNRDRDAIEEGYGFASPPRVNDEALAKTVCEAIWCGLVKQDFGIVAEGLEMLAGRIGYEPWK